MWSVPRYTVQVEMVMSVMRYTCVQALVLFLQLLALHLQGVALDSEGLIQLEHGIKLFLPLEHQRHNIIAFIGHHNADIPVASPRQALFHFALFTFSRRFSRAMRETSAQSMPWTSSRL